MRAGNNYAQLALHAYSQSSGGNGPASSSSPGQYLYTFEGNLLPWRRLLIPENDIPLALDGTYVSVLQAYIEVKNIPAALAPALVDGNLIDISNQSFSGRERFTWFGFQVTYRPQDSGPNLSITLGDNACYFEYDDIDNNDNFIAWTQVAKLYVVMTFNAVEKRYEYNI